MRGEQVPNGARIGFARSAIVPRNAKLSMRDTLADKHADKIMVGYHQQLGGFRETTFCASSADRNDHAG